MKSFVKTGLKHENSLNFDILKLYDNMDNVKVLSNLRVKRINRIASSFAEFEND